MKRKAFLGLALVVALLASCNLPLSTVGKSAASVEKVDSRLLTPEVILIKDSNYDSLSDPQLSNFTALFPSSSYNWKRFEGQPVLGGTYGPITVTDLVKNSDGTVIGFSFTSVDPILAVYVKGGVVAEITTTTTTTNPKTGKVNTQTQTKSVSGGYLYVWNDVQTSGSGTTITPTTVKDAQNLTTAPKPDDPTKFTGVSHFDIAWIPTLHFQPKLTMDLSAATSYLRQYDWDVAKSNDSGSTAANPMRLDPHEKRTVNYAVAVTPSMQEYNFKVFGDITVYNPAYNTDTATLTGFTGVTIAGGSFGTVAPGGSANFSYSNALAGKVEGPVSATVLTTGPVQGCTGTAAYSWGDPLAIYGATANFADSRYSAQNRAFNAVDGAQSWSYSGLVEAFDHTTYQVEKISNSATVVENGSEVAGGEGKTVTSDVFVQMNPQKVTMDLSAAASYLRQYDWSVTKTNDSSLDANSAVNPYMLDPGQTKTVAYTVRVSPSGPNDYRFLVSGQVTVSNPAMNYDDAILTGIPGLTLASPATAILAPGASATYQYSNVLSGKIGSSVAATVNLAAGPVQGCSASAGYSWGGPDAVYGDSTVFTDSLVPGVNQTISSLSGPTVLNYSYDVAATDNVNYLVQAVTNTATVAEVNGDRPGEQNAASSVVYVRLRPPTGYTRSPGYWKTHAASIYQNHPPYDKTWDKLGVYSPFFQSGMSSIEVMWTAPAGNVYYNMAFQYVAAKLNVLTGYRPSATVAAAIAKAEQYFATWTPGKVDLLKGNDKTRQDMINVAGTLGGFNIDRN